MELAPLVAWELALLLATLFHHANLRLPGRADAWIRRLLITPELHGIHHSVVAREVNSNYGTIFSFWDRLHRTFVADVPPAAIVIGLAEVRAPGRVTLLGTLALPFGPVRR